LRRRLAIAQRNNGSAPPRRGHGADRGRGGGPLSQAVLDRLAGAGKPKARGSDYHRQPVLVDRPHPELAHLRCQSHPGQIAVQGAREEQQLSTYQQTVSTSLEEVENTLVAYGLEQVRRARLADAVEANRRAVALSNELYLRGLGNFLNVLDSERSLFASQSDFVQSEAIVSTNVVALYKALGGGRETIAPAQ
jgi:hypothetical protein